MHPPAAPAAAMFRRRDQCGVTAGAGRAVDIAITIATTRRLGYRLGRAGKEPDAARAAVTHQVPLTGRPGDDRIRYRLSEGAESVLGRSGEIDSLANCRRACCDHCRLCGESACAGRGETCRADDRSRVCLAWRRVDLCRASERGEVLLPAHHGWRKGMQNLSAVSERVCGAAGRQCLFRNL